MREGSHRRRIPFNKWRRVDKMKISPFSASNDASALGNEQQYLLALQKDGQPCCIHLPMDEWDTASETFLPNYEDWTRRRQDLNPNLQDRLGTEECVKWCQWNEISKILHVDDSLEQRTHFSWEKERVREGEFYRELAGILKNCSAWV